MCAKAKRNSRSVQAAGAESARTLPTRRNRRGSPPRRWSAIRKKCWKPPTGPADEVDLYEINEAFAVVTMAAMQDLALDHATASTSTAAPVRLAIPIGASGARILVTLVSRRCSAAA